MRILHVIATLKRRGGELFASDLIRSLNEAGESQRVLVLHSLDGAALDLEAPTAILGVAGWKVPGARIAVGTVRRLRHEVSDWKPDVIQAHGGEAFKYLVLSGVSREWPVVYRRIGAAPQWILRGPRRLAHASLMRRAARVVAVAEALRLETVEIFRVPPSRVATIPNGVDADRMRTAKGRRATRQALSLSHRAPVMLSLGALTWEKDPLAHLEISARVFREIPEAVHVIVGDGPFRREMEDAARAHLTNGRVRFLGSREDVPDLMAASDVLILASAVEGMPGSAIEAGMVGLPVAAYAIAGIPEVVLDGVTGRLVPSGDREALARAATELLADERPRRAMGAAAEERCRSLFGIDAVAPRYLELYRELVAK